VANKGGGRGESTVTKLSSMAPRWVVVRCGVVAWGGRRRCSVGVRKKEGGGRAGRAGQGTRARRLAWLLGWCGEMVQNGRCASSAVQAKWG
jgi:hypothetical protein